MANVQLQKNIMHPLIDSGHRMISVTECNLHAASLLFFKSFYSTPMLKRFMPFILVILFLSTFPLLSCCSYSNASEIQTYIVHVESPGNAEFLSIEDRRNWHESFLPSLHLDSGEPRLVYSYTHVISGFAARLNSEDVKSMEGKEGFLHAQLDKELEIMTTYTPAFLGMNQWKGIWWDSDFGAGTIIGIIDTGILPTHPSLSDDGMPLPPLRWRGRCDFNNASLCNNKLIGAMSFKAGHVSSPLDEHGHGTHTASTVVGSQVYDAHVLGHARGSAIGIAPKAHLAIYKVVHDKQGFDSDLFAAIDQAIFDGVDVLSVSLGRVSEQLYDSAAIVGAFAAMEKGVLTCAAAGNAGPYPSVIGNDAPWMLTIGASTTDRRITVTVKLGDGMEVEGEAAYHMSNLERMAPSPIAYPGSNGVLEFKYCRPSTLFAIDIQGKIVICWADSDGNIEKATAIKRAGGAGMILLNSPLQSLTIIVEAHALPVAHLSSRESMKLLSYIDLPSNTCPTATIISEGTRFRAQPSPAVASFSSRGPSLINGGILKPDVISPGVNILAAWSFDISLSQSTAPFNFMSGTSVSTAHLAGIAAMLRSTHPEWSPAMIKSAIMTTAYKQDLDGNHIAAEYPDNSPASDFFAMGAGHVNPSGANDPGLVYNIEPSDYINYLCGLRLTDRKVSVIARRNIQCSNVQKISVEELNYPSISLTLELDRKKTITRNATNVGEAHSVYFVHFDEPEGVTMEVSPDMLYFTRKNQKRSFTIEFNTKDDFTGRGHVSEGQLSWVNKKHTVRSPISINFV